MVGYTSSEVSRMLDLPVSQVRSYARAGVLAPNRGRRGEYRFTFQDLVLLRTAKGLEASDLPPKKIRNALQKLRQQLPKGRPLSAVQIAADGDKIVVRDGPTVWDPESGQKRFDFSVRELAEKVAPLARRHAEEAFEAAEEFEADEWYALGCDLEPAEPDHARDAYRRALEIDPYHAEAHINLGRLLHEAGLVTSAEAHYRLALASRPGDATAAFDLGVALEDLDRLDDATEAYRIALANDPRLADAHYNLAQMCERQGDSAGALRHLRAYRDLTGN